MAKLLHAELRRLFKRKLFWLGIAVMFGLATWATLARYYDATHLVGMGYDTPDGLLFIGATYFPIVVAVFDSLFIGTEFSDGTLRNKLIVGKSRFGIYLSKLAVTTVGLLMIYITYAVTVLGFSACLLKPFETPTQVLSTFFLCSLITVIALNGIILLLCMLIHNKATSAVVCMLLALALIMGGMTVMQMLNAPEFLSGPPSVINGTVIESEPRPNPKYLTGAKRSFFQFLHDFLPGGQMLTFGMSSELPPHVWKLPIYSLVLTLITTLGGMLAFRRRDLK